MKKKQIIKVEKSTEEYKKYNRQLRKTKKSLSKIQKKKQYELSKKRNLVGKGNESNKEIKQIERKQK